MADIPNGTVLFAGWNMTAQIAVDSEDRIWKVDGWFDDDGDEIPIDTKDWVGWDDVAYVTLWSIIDGDKIWTGLFPDDFGQPTEG
jgi:hypothetical protein